MKKKSCNISFSFVVPIYNGERYIKRCLDSLLAQTYENFEIIVVDDGSSDKTKLICNSINNDKIKYIYQENQGVSVARNTGLKNVKTSYFTFVDVDDFVDEDLLENIFNVIIDTNADIVKYGYVKEANKIKKEYNFSSKTDTLITNKDYSTDIYQYIFNSFDFTNVWNAFFRSDRFVSLKFDKEYKYAEDFKFMIDALSISENIYFLSNKMYHYIYNENSAINVKNNQKKIRALKDNIEVITYISEKIGISKAKKIEEQFRQILSEMKFKNYKFYLNEMTNLEKELQIDLKDKISFKYYTSIKILSLKSSLKKCIIKIIENII